MVIDHSPLGFFVTVIRRSGNISTSLTPFPSAYSDDGGRLRRRKPREPRGLRDGRVFVQHNHYAACGGAHNPIAEVPRAPVRDGGTRDTGSRGDYRFVFAASWPNITFLASSLIGWP